MSCVVASLTTPLQSFCPATGEIKRVTVYPSEYGLKQLVRQPAATRLWCVVNATAAATLSLFAGGRGYNGTGWHLG